MYHIFRQKTSTFFLHLQFILSATARGGDCKGKKHMLFTNFKLSLEISFRTYVRNALQSPPQCLHFCLPLQNNLRTTLTSSARLKKFSIFSVFIFGYSHSYCFSQHINRYHCNCKKNYYTPAYCIKRLTAEHITYELEYGQGNNRCIYYTELYSYYYEEYFEETCIFIKTLEYSEIFISDIKAVAKCGKYEQYKISRQMLRGLQNIPSDAEGTVIRPLPEQGTLI